MTVPTVQQKAKDSQDGAIVQQGNDIQGKITAAWEEPVDKVAELIKAGVKGSAQALANCSTAPCGPTGECINPVLVTGIAAGADPVIDASVSLVKAAIKACSEESPEQLEQK